jgi:hypothetical protein
MEVNGSSYMYELGVIGLTLHKPCELRIAALLALLAAPQIHQGEREKCQLRN